MYIFVKEDNKFVKRLLRFLLKICDLINYLRIVYFYICFYNKWSFVGVIFIVLSII